MKKLLRNFLIFIGVAILAFGGLYLYIRLQANSPRTLELGTNIDGNRFDYAITKSWNEGANGYKYGMQVDLEIENLTAGVMRDWDVELELVDDCALKDFWNGEFYLEGNTLHILSVDYNETIDSGELQGLGMIIHSSEKDCVKSGKLTYYEKKRMLETPLFWIFVVACIITLISFANGLYYTTQGTRIKEKQKAAFKIINQSFITFANTIDAKDSYTKGHSQRVAFYSRELAKRLGYDEEFQQNIFYVGLLHDIGKIGVQDAILKKSTKLTYDEFNEIKEHVSMGGEILHNFTAIEGIEAGARYHHERYDGTGYVEGLAGDEIPIVARIISVADAFDAMSSARCYRSAMSMEEIVKELETCSGKQFDPGIVPHMINLINEGKVPVTLSERQLEEELEF